MTTSQEVTRPIAARRRAKHKHHERETMGNRSARDLTIRLGAPRSEFSEQFVQGMADRMAFSFHKYGPLTKNYPVPAHALDSLMDRLRKYEETGNTEYLMDVGNFAMIEFMRPAHPKAFFRPTDSNESPGVRLWTGKRVQDRPADYRDND